MTGDDDDDGSDTCTLRGKTATMSNNIDCFIIPWTHAVALSMHSVFIKKGIKIIPECASVYTEP